MTARKTVGLVLGSGSSRGWAHIGAIEALEAAGIPIDLIAGCSVGAYVGVIYASGGLASLKDFVLRMDGRKVFSYFDVTFPRYGLLDGNKRLRELLSMHSTAETFADLKLPLKMVATELRSGDKVVLQNGRLFDALRATMSIPGLFEPVRFQDRWLVDGGLVDPVPVGVARAMGADLVIAVDLNSGLISRRERRQQAVPVAIPEAAPPSDGGYQGEMARKLSEMYEQAGSTLKKKFREVLHLEPNMPDMPDIIEAVSMAMGIMQERVTRINLAVEPPDVLIQPRLGELRMMDFDQVEKAIEEGSLGVQDRLADIRAELGLAMDAR